MTVITDPERVKVNPPTWLVALDGIEVEAWLFDVVTADGQVIELLAADPADRKDVLKARKQLTDLALAAKANGPIDGVCSRDFWQAVRWFSHTFGHDAAPRYATTVHRAQGGQWQHIFLDAGDINGAIRYDKDGHRRLLYTGATRAQSRLTWIGG
jgi:hypothetical protein